jgi:L-amino acid N-acyltransferase YncA
VAPLAEDANVTAAAAGELALPIVVRASREDDVEAMLAIYRHHIRTGVEPSAVAAAEPLDSEDLKRRRKNMRNHRLPHIVAELRGIVVGYAYAVPFRKRPAYRYTLKHSIYVHPDHLRSGVGRALLPALIDACAAAGRRQLIGYIDAANAASIRLHESFGFRQVGVLPAVAFKFGHWADSIMMQRSLGPGDTTPPMLWPSDPGAR